MSSFSWIWTPLIDYHSFISFVHLHSSLTFMPRSVIRQYYLTVPLRVIPMSECCKKMFFINIIKIQISRDLFGYKSLYY